MEEDPAEDNTVRKTYSMAEVALAAGVSLPTMYRHRAAGLLPSPRAKEGLRVRYTQSQLDRIVQIYTDKKEK